MCARVDPAKIDYAVKLWDAGHSVQHISEVVGHSHITVTRHLRNRGVTIKKLGRPMLRARRDIPVDELVSLYESGASELELSKRFGIARTGIRPRLEAAGVTIRGMSAAATVRFNQSTPEYRQRITKAAHDTIRGVAKSEQTIINMSIGRQHARTHVGRGEDSVILWLRERGYDSIPQCAAYGYNIDVAVHPVAVEVHMTSANPVNISRIRKRIKKLTDNGWHVLYIWIGKPGVLNKPPVTDDIVAFIEQAKSDPSPIGQYRVIRGSGKFVTAGRGDLD